MSRLTLAVSALSVAGFVAATPAVAGPRAFVASTGNDANTATSCAPTTPCRSFTAALTVVDAGGEIIALDAAGYGAVTITKSVTITANPGFYAGIAASSGNAVTIATGGVNVILRRLNINSTGATNGIDMSSGASLSVESCVISGFSTGAGINVTTAAIVNIVDSLVRGNYAGADLAGGSTSTIAKSQFLNNSFTQVFVDGTVAATTSRAVITDSVFSNGYIGVDARVLVGGAFSRITVERSTISNNSYGVGTESSGSTATVGSSQVFNNPTAGFFNQGTTVETMGNNTARSNGANLGVITAVSLF